MGKFKFLLFLLSLLFAFSAGAQVQPGLPAAPQLVYATPSGECGKINVSWSSVTSATSYKVYRYDWNSNSPPAAIPVIGSLIATVNAPATLYVDSVNNPLQPNPYFYIYYVKASNSAGDSVYATRAGDMAAATYTQVYAQFAAPSAFSCDLSEGNVTANRAVVSSGSAITFSLTPAASADHWNFSVSCAPGLLYDGLSCTSLTNANIPRSSSTKTLTLSYSGSNNAGATIYFSEFSATSQIRSFPFQVFVAGSNSGQGSTTPPSTFNPTPAPPPPAPSPIPPPPPSYTPPPVTPPAATPNYVQVCPNGNTVASNCTTPPGAGQTPYSSSGAAGGSSSGNIPSEFRVGDYIASSGAAEVRSDASASSRLLTTYSAGIRGTVVGGPVQSGGTLWWQVHFTTPSGSVLVGWVSGGRIAHADINAPYGPASPPPPLPPPGTPPTPPPSGFTFTASPATITTGAYAGITWNAPGMNWCDFREGNSDAVIRYASFGGLNVSPSVTTSYHLLCGNNSGQTSSRSITVIVSGSGGTGALRATISMGDVFECPVVDPAECMRQFRLVVPSQAGRPEYTFNLGESKTIRVNNIDYNVKFFGTTTYQEFPNNRFFTFEVRIGSQTDAASTVPMSVGYTSWVQQRPSITLERVEGLPPGETSVEPTCGITRNSGGFIIASAIECQPTNPGTERYELFFSPPFSGNTGNILNQPNLRPFWRGLKFEQLRTLIINRDFENQLGSIGRGVSDILLALRKDPRDACIIYQRQNATANWPPGYGENVVVQPELLSAGLTVRVPIAEAWSDTPNFCGGTLSPPPPAPPPAGNLMIGDRVRVTASPSLNVRPSGSLNNTPTCAQATGTTGTIISGPTTGSGFTWWQVDYDTGCDGWSGENYLVKISSTGGAGTGTGTSVGMRVTNIAASDIFSQPTGGSTKVGYAPVGSLGRVLEETVQTTAGLVWARVDFDSLPDGWVPKGNLTPSGTAGPEILPASFSCPAGAPSANNLAQAIADQLYWTFPDVWPGGRYGGYTGEQVALAVVTKCVSSSHFVPPSEIGQPLGRIIDADNPFSMSKPENWAVGKVIENDTGANLFVFSQPDRSGVSFGPGAGYNNQLAGARGKITSGPVSDNHGYTLWQVDFEVGADGWIVDPTIVLPNGVELIGTAKSYSSIVTYAPGPVHGVTYPPIGFANVVQYRVATARSLGRGAFTFDLGPATPLPRAFAMRWRVGDLERFPASGWWNIPYTLVQGSASPAIKDPGPGAWVDSELLAADENALYDFLKSVIPELRRSPAWANPLPVSPIHTGDRIRLSSNTNVRVSPGLDNAVNTVLGVQPIGAQGTVVGGPVATGYNANCAWWQIDYDTGVDGWSANLFMVNATTGAYETTCTRP